MKEQCKTPQEQQQTSEPGIQESLGLVEGYGTVGNTHQPDDQVDHPNRNRNARRPVSNGDHRRQGQAIYL